MKVLLLLMFLKMINADADISEKLNDIVFKYTYESKGNPEFSSWIKQLNHIAKTAGSTVKSYALRDFKIYNDQRQDLEEKIMIRINELESLFPDRRLSEACVDDYLAQKSALIKYKTMSNEEKHKALSANSRVCTLVDTTQKPPPSTTTLISTSTTPGVNKTLISTSPAPGVNKTLISTSTDPGVTMTLTSTSTTPGVNMTLISTSTEPQVTVTLTGTSKDPGETITDSGKTTTHPWETNRDSGKDMIIASTDSGTTMTSISTSTIPETTMTSISPTTSPGVTKNFPNVIKSPFSPIINHC